MPTLTLRFLGPFQATLDGVPLSGFESDKARALLAYLAVESSRPHSRLHLANLLWPDWPDSTARTYLRHSLNNLRNILGDKHRVEPFLLVTRQTLQLNVRSNCDVDTLQLESLLASPSYHMAAAHGQHPANLSVLREIVDLYRSPFLEGFSILDCPQFELWLMTIRERMKNAALDGLGTLIAHYRATGELSIGIRYSRRCIEIEPWNEDAHMQLIQFLHQDGQRSAALAQYEQCRQILLDELQTTPGEELVKLHHEISRSVLNRAMPASPSTRTDSDNTEIGHRQAAKILPVHNLPAPMTSLVGRCSLVADVASLLSEPYVRLLTLTGPGGVGKTRLSIAVARTLLPDFSDGVFFVQLAPLSDPAQTIMAIAQTLGLSLDAEQSYAEVLVEYLKNRELMLVIDNFEHLLGAAPEVSKLLTAIPSLKVLATSREPLHIYGEHEVEVQPLKLPGASNPASETLAQVESVSLFRERVRAANPQYVPTSDDLRIIGEICCRLDGLPLAIELAAARVKNLTPSVILEQLSNRFELLKDEIHGRPNRHQTLGRAIDWSYDLLSPEEQQILQSISVFVGGCTLPGVVAVWKSYCTCIVDDALQFSDDSFDILTEAKTQALKHVDALVEKNLVVRKTEYEKETRYSLLETVREYGLNKLAESGFEISLLQAHANYYCQLAESGEQALRSDKIKPWLTRLELENNNIRTALDNSIRYLWTANALRMGSAICYYWSTRNYQRTERELLTQILDLDAIDNYTHLAAKLMLGIGKMAEAQSDYNAADKYLNKSLHRFRVVDDLEGVAHALDALGILCRTKAQFGDALEFHKESLRYFSMIHDQWGMAYVQIHLGILAMLMDDNGGARRYIEDGLQSAKLVNARALVATAIGKLGSLALAENDYETALRHFNDFINNYGDLGSRTDVAYFLGEASLAACYLDLLDKAVGFLKEGLEISVEFDNFWVTTNLFGCAALLMAKLCDPQSALTMGSAQAALRNSSGASLLSFESANLDKATTLARQQLSTDEANSAWQKGENMSLDTAIEFALAILESPEAIS